MVWVISASYHRTIHATQVQPTFSREIIFNLVTGVYWQVITAVKSGKWELMMSKKTLGKLRMTAQLTL